MFHLASSVSRRLALQLLASQVPRRITASCWGIQSQSPIVGPIHLQLYSTTQSPYTTRYAFAFDIDGVLVRGKRVLQQAIAALDKLYHPPPPGATVPIQRVPFVFLTNGGGVLESTKAAQLSQWLGKPIDEGHVVLSHTPFKQLVPTYASQPVLVLGRNRVPEVASAYGFRHVVTTQQLVEAFPHAVPLKGVPDEPAWEAGVQLPGGTPTRPIRAIFVFNDPADWYRDLQLTIDVLLGGGVLGHHIQPPHAAPVIPLFFSNPDLLWANEHPAPRFGQGAFAAALHALYEKVAGIPLRGVRVFGKPNPDPYALAEQLLVKQLSRMEGDGHADGHSADDDDHRRHHHHRERRQHGQHQTAKPPPCNPFTAIYAVGDNPAADVRGANAAGPPWVSVLVHTGVFQPSHGITNCQQDPAEIVVPDVDAAVDAALHRERHATWHALR